jgi:hypothetical protein
MKTTDFMNEVTVESLNKDLRSKFGISVDISKYSKTQLEDYSNKIGAKLHQFETKKGFNESLTSDEYQKTLLIKKIVESAINQYIDNPLEDADDLGEDIIDVDDTDEDVARDFAEDEKADVDADGEEEPTDEPDDSEMKLSGTALAALKGLMTDPTKAQMAKIAIEKIVQGKMLNSQQIDAIDDVLHQTVLPIIDKGMAGVQRSKPLMRSLGVGQESMQEGYAKMPLKADVMKCVKDGMSEADICEKYKDCDKDRIKLMASSCMKEYKKNESVIKEGAEDQAELVMAAKDMVDRFTAFLEDVAEMGAEGMLELADSIRDEMGQEKSQAFVDLVKPALTTAQETLTSTREALTQGVGVLTGEEAPADTIGAEPEGDIEEPADMDMPAEEPIDTADEFGASDAATGGTEPEGREKRESYTPRKQSIAESTKIYRKLAE